MFHVTESVSHINSVDANSRQHNTDITDATSTNQWNAIILLWGMTGMRKVPTVQKYKKYNYSLYLQSTILPRVKNYRFELFFLQQ